MGKSTNPDKADTWALGALLHPPGPIFKVVAIFEVDKHGPVRCMVRSNRGRDTGRNTRRATSVSPLPLRRWVDGVPVDEVASRPPGTGRHLIETHVYDKFSVGPSF
jgi:hypothetical protein